MYKCTCNHPNNLWVVARLPQRLKSTYVFEIKADFLLRFSHLGFSSLWNGREKLSTFTALYRDNYTTHTIEWKKLNIFFYEFLLPRITYISR